MTTNAAWQYQGRQQHGWFGHGTAPSAGPDPSDVPDVFGQGSLSDRIDYAAYSLIALVPRGDRSSWSGVTAAANLAALRKLVPAWAAASALGRDAFRSRFISPNRTDTGVAEMRKAASQIVRAGDSDDLASASKSLAAAAVQIGPHNWASFLGDAALRLDEDAPEPSDQVKPIALRDDLDGSPLPPSADATPVPFIDDQGRPILDREGVPMVRPQGFDPHYFAKQGSSLTAFAASPGKSNLDAILRLSELATILSKFRQGNEWDAQRLGGRFHREFVSFSTVIIGIMGAAMGLREGELLDIQNRYASMKSDFGPKALMSTE